MVRRLLDHGLGPFKNLYHHPDKTQNVNIALEGRAKTQKLMKRGALSVEYLTTQLVGHTTIVTKTRVVGDEMTVVRSETSPFTSNNFENDQIMSRMCVKRGGREVEISSAIYFNFKFNFKTTTLAAPSSSAVSWRPSPPSPSPYCAS